MRHTGITALVLALGGFAAAGCGSRTATTNAVRTSFIAKADTICEHIYARQNATDIKSRRDYVRIVPSLTAYEKVAFAELSRLTPPAPLASDWRRIAAAAQTLAGYSARLHDYAKANDVRDARPLLPAAARVRRQMAAVARRDGFRACSSP